MSAPDSEERERPQNDRETLNPATAPAPASGGKTTLEISPTMIGPLPTQMTPWPQAHETPPISAPRENAVTEKLVRPIRVPVVVATEPEPVAPAKVSKRYSEIFPALRKARQRRAVEQLQEKERGRSRVWIGAMVAVAGSLGVWLKYSAQGRGLGETGNIAMLGLMLVVMSGLLFFGKSYFAGAGNARGIRDGGHPIEPASVKREITGPQADRPWTNSLGMSFVPVAGTGVLFSVWDTRVQDFEAFVLATRHDAAAGMWSLGRDGWKQRGDTWRSPGFVQGPAHPVCGVSWDDARAFCAWLTRKEQAAGEIGPEQSYRLPTDAEWSAAVGDGLYPWGSQWPPPAGAGNYAGAEAADENWPVKYTTIAEYRDGYARTSPVGSFNANQYGLYDMGGNLWQWCEDWYRKELNRDDVRKQKPALDDDGGGQMYRVLRGGSWHIGTPLYMRSDCRYGSGPGNRNDVIGFRCVLASIKAEAV